MTAIYLRPITTESDDTCTRDEVQQVIAAQRSLYVRVGERAPWVGYFAHTVATDEIVGSCSFVGPPAEGSVEIAYFTFPEFQHRGVAKAMAGKLLAIAKESGAVTSVYAFTLPEPNASTGVLTSLGFLITGTATDDEAGEVWRWQIIVSDWANVVSQEKVT